MLPNGILPYGTVISYAGAIDPGTYMLNSGTLKKYRFSPHANNNTGWILCDGSPLSHSMFPKLFNTIGYWYGGANGSFNIPDYQGYFFRGFDKKQNSNANEDREDEINATGQNLVGSIQGDMVQMHEHYYNLATTPQTFVTSDKGKPALTVSKPLEPTTDLFKSTAGDLSGSETRPINIYVHYLIYAGLPGK